MCCEGDPGHLRMSRKKIVPLPVADDADLAHGVYISHGRVKGGQAGETKIIPFPKPQNGPVPSNVIPFPLVEAAICQGGAQCGSELPVASADSEENAQSTDRHGVRIHGRPRSRALREQPPSPTGARSRSASRQMAAASGTSGAELAACMDSAVRSEQREPDFTGDAGVKKGRAGEDVSRPETPLRSGFSVETAGAMEWQEGRPVSCSDRFAPGHPFCPNQREMSPAAEQIFLLLLREALLARQSASDSMTVLLRIDEGTEFVVHLTQANGRLNAVVRCERGDLLQLRAVWSQVQEAMALQHVCLAWLGEPLTTARDASENDAPLRVRDAGTLAGPLAENNFTDEWPSPASAVSHSHVRRRRSRSRFTTSRPGWETWA